MLKKIFSTLACITFSSAVMAEPIVMSYWENWATYENCPMPNNAKGSKNPLLANQIAGLNALAYAFLFVGDDGSLEFSDTWSDLDPNSELDKQFCKKSPVSCPGFPQNAGHGNFSAFTKTKVKHHIVSIGGGGQDQTFVNAFQHPDKFVASLKALVETYNFDSIDLDYEPENGVPAEHAQPFIELTSKIKAALPSLNIYYTINSISHNIDKFGASNWKKLEKNLTYISIMGYDMHGAFDSDFPYTALHSALVASKHDSSGENALKALKRAGISSEKIILGLPLYGRGVGGVKGDGLNQIFTLGMKGDMDGKNCSTNLKSKNLCSGVIQYKTIVDQSYTPTPVMIGNHIAGVYAYDATKKVFISYDNPESAAAKAQYAIDNKMAGVMMWALRFDKPIDDAQSVLAAIGKVYETALIR